MSQLTLLERLQFVDTLSLFTTIGYIREIQNSLSHLIIPEEVIQLCVIFYFQQILWDLSYLNKDDSTIISLSASHPITAPINRPISKAVCDIFEFEIVINKAKIITKHSIAQKQKQKKRDILQFDIGFIRGSLGRMKRNKDLNMEFLKKRISESIKITKNRIYSSKWAFSHQLSEYLTRGDRIKMNINFNKNECKWYWNDQKYALYTVSIDTDQVIPAISIHWNGLELEIINVSFK